MRFWKRSFRSPDGFRQNGYQARRIIWKSESYGEKRWIRMAGKRTIIRCSVPHGLNGPDQIYRAGTSYFRTPCSQRKYPELSKQAIQKRYVEAFANLYSEFCQMLFLCRSQVGPKAKKRNGDYPGVEDGIREMAFIEHVLKSTFSELNGLRSSGRKVKIKHYNLKYSWTIKGPAIFLAQFADDAAPFNNLKNICAYMAI